MFNCHDLVSSVIFNPHPTVFCAIGLSTDCALNSHLASATGRPNPLDFCQTPPAEHCAPSRQLYQSQLIPGILSTSVRKSCLGQSHSKSL
ncbi:hypothetical protein ACN38_g3761 [Penicillium nordicum]|uniref:Uncharacterized protein n=1 Tax=Penicillium nordicum TaxID=229535 RepID=A0A0M8PD81_9EURO|nr:hypothetical protein ACN38_g3761 [Penicillium nordicum]